MNIMHGDRRVLDVHQVLSGDHASTEKDIGLGIRKTNIFQLGKAIHI